MRLISDRCKEFLVRLMDHQPVDQVLTEMQLTPGEKLLIIGDLGFVVERLKSEIQEMTQSRTEFHC